MDALILASHVPGEHILYFDTAPVAAVCCQADFDYWQAFADRWDDQELVLVGVEHDMDASDEHIAALLACPEPLCSWAYCVHWASTGLPYDVIAAGMGARDPETNPDPEHLQGGEEWAAWSAIGLCKIAPEARIAPLRREPWQRLELAVHDAVKRPWHMHGPPVDHWHW